MSFDLLRELASKHDQELLVVDLGIADVVTSPS